MSSAGDDEERRALIEQGKKQKMMLSELEAEEKYVSTPPNNTHPHTSHTPVP